MSRRGPLLRTVPLQTVARRAACAVAVCAVAACSHDDPSALLDSLPSAATTTATAPPPTTTSTTTTTTTTTTSTTSTTVPATLPTPVDPPPEDGSTEPLVQVGTVEISKLGLVSPIFEGIRLATIDHGPGHWPNTAMPGQPGNVVLAGHRTSHNAEFRHLDRLAVGDEVVLTTADGRFAYAVTSVEVVGPDALWIVDQTPDRTATLFACHPPGSVRSRIVAHLVLSA